MAHSPSNSAPAPRLCSIAQAAQYLDVSTRTLRNYIAAGELPAYRVGPRPIRIRLADVEALLRPVRAERVEKR